MPPNLLSNDKRNDRIINHNLQEDDDLDDGLMATAASILSATPLRSSIDDDRRRRRRQSSIECFPQETSTVLPTATTKDSAVDTQPTILNDDYLLQRQTIHSPSQQQPSTKKIPLSVNWTVTKTRPVLDGATWTQLWVAAYAHLHGHVDRLNHINVFPIADGDTGANLKAGLQYPIRNLVLQQQQQHHDNHSSSSSPSSSLSCNSSINDITQCACHLAADVVLHGQGNSGTILSHWLVSLARAIYTRRQQSSSSHVLSVHDFAMCLVETGHQMNQAVSNPVEGTLVSVSRDACVRLAHHGPYETLYQLLETWYHLAQQELQKTPDQLVVNGVKVLKEAQVVDSGAQGFCYLIEGMYRAVQQGQLPPLQVNGVSIFQSAPVVVEKEGTRLDVDHTVCDSHYRYCTEAVVLVREGITADTVVSTLQEANLGDSLASVRAPAKAGSGGDMVKIHIHTNTPQAVFDHLLPYSQTSILQKEKVEDMYFQRDYLHNGERSSSSGDNWEHVKFTLVGLGSTVLPPMDVVDHMVSLPVFMLPSTTQEPIDLRFTTASDTCSALNQQRHEDTAIRYTSAAANPMQMKLELLTALSKNKPVLVSLMSTDSRVSAFGRNVLAAVDMLTPKQHSQIKLLETGWGSYEAIFNLEAMECARQGKTIDEAYDTCKHVADHSFNFMNLLGSATVKKLMAWRPNLFPKDFTVKDGQYVSFGLPIEIRDKAPTMAERTDMIMTLQTTGSSLSDIQDREIERLKRSLQPGQKIARVLISCAGRPDYGQEFVDKIKAAKVRKS